MSIEIRPNPASAGSATGGLTYRGSYNATTNTPDLTSSVKGDFYIVSTGGTLAGIALNVGDHIVFNQDAASPITSAMFDVIDNTDAVSTVNGLTGSVVLNLKTINDVNATLTPSDSTFLVGDGSEWTGESGATARTSLGLSIGSDVQAFDAQLTDIAGLTPTDGNIIIGNGSNFITESGATARTSLGLSIGSDVQAHDAQLDDVAGLTPGDGAFIVGDGSNFVTETLGDARTSLGLGTVATLDVGNGANQIVQMTAAAKLPAVDGSLLTNISATDSTRLLKTANLSDVASVTDARSNLGLAIGSDVQAYDAQLADIAGLTPTDSHIIVGNGSNFVTESGATARTSLGLSIGSDVQAHNAKLDDIAGLAVTDGNIIVGDGSNFVTESGATARTSLGLSIGSDVQAYDAQLADIAGLTPTDSNFIVGDGSNFTTESGATARTSLGLSIGSDVQAYDAQLTDVAGLTPADGAFIVGDGSNFVTETLGTARTSLGLGTVATLDVGTGANNVVQLDGSSRLPAVDGSQLTNLPSGGGLTYQARDTTAHSPLTPAANYHYSINANSATFVINLPALSSVTDGDQIRVKFQARGNAAYDITINRNGTDTIDGQTAITLDVLYSSVTLVAGSTEWEIV